MPLNDAFNKVAFAAGVTAGAAAMNKRLQENKQEAPESNSPFSSKPSKPKGSKIFGPGG
jgi:hypothetical protein